MERFKKLPVVLNTYIIAECWTHYKLAIIQASQFADSWLASHLDVITNDKLRTSFGTTAGPYEMDYYSNIVISEEIPLWETPPEIIIDTIINCIREDRYIQLFVANKNCFAFDNFEYHEIFIYGFDEINGCFFASTVNNGRFVETLVPFDEIKERYEMFHEFCKRNVEIITFYRNYQYPITKLSLNKNYDSKNDIFNFLRKVDRESISKEINISEYDESQNILFNYSLYTGLGCLIALSNSIKKGIEMGYLEEMDLHRARDTTCKLLNHRNIILHSMEWVKSVVGSNAGTDQVVEQYRATRNNFEIIESLLCKYTNWKYRKPELLKKIGTRVEEQYKDEKQILVKYHECLLALFSNSLKHQ